MGVAAVTIRGRLARPLSNAKHPQEKPAATAIFFFLFSMASLVFYGVLTTLSSVFDSKYILTETWVAARSLGCVFLPVFVLAGVQIRTPPTAAPMV